MDVLEGRLIAFEAVAARVSQRVGQAALARKRGQRERVGRQRGRLRSPTSRLPCSRRPGGSEGELPDAHLAAELAVPALPPLVLQAGHGDEVVPLLASRPLTSSTASTSNKQVRNGAPRRE